MLKNIKTLLNSLLILFSILIISGNSVAQDNIRWGTNKKNSRKRIISNVHYIDSNNFILTRYKPARSGYKHTYYFSRYVNFQVTKEIEIKLPSSFGTTKLESTVFLNGLPVAFFSDYRNGKFLIYAQKYSKNCETVGTPLLINELVTPIKLNLTGNGEKYCHFIYSTDKSKVAISMTGEEKEDIKNCMYVILNADLTILAKGNYEQMEYKSIFQDGRSFLTNQGELFCLNTVLKETEEENNNYNWILDHFLVYWINEKGLEKIKLSASDELRIVSSVSLNVNKVNKIMINGVYGENFAGPINNKGIFNIMADPLAGSITSKGIFNIMVDPSKKDKIIETIYQFEPGFIKDNWFENYNDGRQKNKFSNRKIKKISNLKTKHFLSASDGSMIGTYEFEEQILSGGYSGGGPTYKFGSTGVMTSGPSAPSVPNIITISKGTYLFKVDTSGNFNWLREIPKFQLNGSSLNTLSYLFNHGEKLTIMFNDHLPNYSVEGNFTGKPVEKVSKANAKKRVTAKIDIQLENGEIKRSCLTGKELIDLTLIMKGFHYDPESKLLYMSYHSKGLQLGQQLEKFGIMRVE